MARVEPRTFGFEELIQQVQLGILRCPRFQRSFVWRGDQVLEFFDSIRLRYPVGSLLIWRTPDRYSSFDRVGPIPVPANEPQAPTPVGYMLDGHQRISAIFGVAALTDEQAAGLRGGDRVFLVYYDLATEKFVHSRHPKPHHLPARYLLGQGDQLTQWLDDHRDGTAKDTPDRALWDSYRRRATQLQTTFAQYRLPYLDVTEASLEEAVNIFARVNSQGTSVRRNEVFAALTWRSDFDFAGAAKSLLEQFPLYMNFGTEPVLRSLLAALDENLYESDWQGVLDRHRTTLPGALDEVGEAFGRSLAFLDTELGASSGKVVPYSLHIVLLTEFFRRNPAPDDSARAELSGWLWATSFASAYTSAGSLLFNDAVHLAQRLAAGERVSLLAERLRLRPFPRRFHPKSARVRVFHLFLKQQAPLDPRTGKLLGPSLLSNGMADARALTPAAGSSESWRLSGRLLLGAKYRRALEEFQHLAVSHRQPKGLDDRDTAAILRSHAIPEAALDSLLANDLPTFLDLRERELVRVEREFASKYVDIPEVGETEEEPEIDVEEQPESDL